MDSDPSAMVQLYLHRTWYTRSLMLSRNLTRRIQHAHALENLLPFLHPGATVLDVGSGSGYLCAVLHHLVSPSQPGAPQGNVIGIDHIPELVEWSTSNLINNGLGSALDEGKILVVAGDGRQGKLYSLLEVKGTELIYIYV